MFTTVSDDYFRTLGIPLRSGRTFGSQDRVDAPPTVIINETMAQRYWPNGNAMAARIRLSPRPDVPPFTIVGVVGDERNDPARAQSDPTMYCRIGSIRSTGRSSRSARGATRWRS